MPVSAAHLAREWEVDPVTIKRLRLKGLIPYIKIGPKLVRYDLEAVREALEKVSAREQGTSPPTGGTDMPAAQAAAIQPRGVLNAHSSPAAPTAPKSVGGRR